jgi:hypothetical protein
MVGCTKIGSWRGYGLRNQSERINLKGWDFILARINQISYISECFRIQTSAGSAEENMNINQFTTENIPKRHIGCCRVSDFCKNSKLCLRLISDEHKSAIHGSFRGPKLDEIWSRASFYSFQWSRNTPRKRDSKYEPCMLAMLNVF